MLRKGFIMNLQELITAIEQWAEDRNIIKGSKPIDQAMKLFSEFGELADNVGKGRDCRDDIGDCAVVMTIIMAQSGLNFYDYAKNCMLGSIYDLKYNVAQLGAAIGDFVSDISSNNYISLSTDDFIYCIEWLNIIATKVGSSLQECIQIAYNDISKRTGILWNGVFIKSTDDNYDEIKSMYEKSIENNHQI